MSAEEELREIRKAVQRVVHDVNNALAPVLGFTELLLEDDELLGDAEKVKRYLNFMHDGANEALSLVTSMRAYYQQNRPDSSFE